MCSERCQKIDSTLIVSTILMVKIRGQYEPLPNLSLESLLTDYLRQMPDMATFLIRTLEHSIQGFSISRGTRLRQWILSKDYCSRLYTRPWKMVRSNFYLFYSHANKTSWHPSRKGHWITDIRVLWLLYKRLQLHHYKRSGVLSQIHHHGHRKFHPV